MANLGASQRYRLSMQQPDSELVRWANSLPFEAIELFVGFSSFTTAFDESTSANPIVFDEEYINTAKFRRGDIGEWIVTDDAGGFYLFRVNMSPPGISTGSVNTSVDMQVIVQSVVTRRIVIWSHRDLDLTAGSISFNEFTMMHLIPGDRVSVLIIIAGDSVIYPGGPMDGDDPTSRFTLHLARVAL